MVICGSNLYNSDVSNSLNDLCTDWFPTAQLDGLNAVISYIKEIGNRERWTAVDSQRKKQVENTPSSPENTKAAL